MIERIKGTAYGYRFSNEVTREEYNIFMNKFLKGNDLKCFICNKNTAKRFSPSLFKSIITINNNVGDNVFFLNHCF